MGKYSPEEIDRLNQQRGDYKKRVKELAQKNDLDVKDIMRADAKEENYLRFIRESSDIENATELIIEYDNPDEPNHFYVT